MSCCGSAVTAGHDLCAPEVGARIAEDRVIDASQRLDGNLWLTRFIVPDMHCIACIKRIENALSSLDHVKNVRANLSLREVSVQWDASAGTGREVQDTLHSEGFAHHFAEHDVSEDPERSREHSLLLALAVAGFAAANIMLLSVSVWSGADAETAQLFHLISGIIAVPAVAIAGRPFFRSALNALKVRRLNMDVPISLAVLLALGMSIFESMRGGEEAYFDASVSLLFFLLIGRYLDQLMRNKARGASERLASMSAKGGLKIGNDGELSHLPVAEIKPGDLLRVFPGERFPVDGEVVKGSSNVDCSHVTGESAPVTSEPGRNFQAGSLNLTSPLDIRATSDADKSFLGEMQRMMRAAENGRGRYVRIADRMAQIYAPAVHLLALITFVLWMVTTGGDWHTSIYTAIAVLIITCPCALGLAVPVAHVIGAKRLMEEGVLMRDGTALERLAEIDTTVFDKTGTLTEGTAAIRSVPVMKERQAAIVGALASSSSHPVARALTAISNSGNSVDVIGITEFPGMGMEGTVAGRKVRLGRPEWVAEIADVNREGMESASVAFAEAQKQAVFFMTEERLRLGATDAVAELGRKNLDLVVLSGDRKEKVKRVAIEVGIDRYLAEQSPADKIACIEELKADGKKVLMVGDGVNDAPALVAGNVSMTPANASDVGRMTSDFVFTRDSLVAVPFTVGISRVTGRIVRQNFGLAIAYNCIAVPLAMAGFVTPLIAAIAMSVSSIVVVANSMRINLEGRTRWNSHDRESDAPVIERVPA